MTGADRLPPSSTTISVTVCVPGDGAGNVWLGTLVVTGGPASSCQR
ncbi:MAG: hypothetical protein R2752_09895 [Vicinamibacterales bacterium]